MNTFSFHRRLSARLATARQRLGVSTFANDRPRLVLRLAEGETDIEWLIVSGITPRVVAQGHGTLQQVRDALAAYPGISRACVLVPTTDVSVHRLTVPHQARRQWQQALPFMVEDLLAADVETVHCTVLAWQGELATVAVVAREKMQQWLTACTALGVKPDSLLPDVMALPLPTVGLNALRHRDLWLFRQPDGGGVAAEQAWHGMLLTALSLATPSPEATPVETTAVKGHCFSASLPDLGDWTPQPATSLLMLASTTLASAPAGLAQGMFAPVRAWRSRWDAWRNLAVLVACYLLLLVGDGVSQHYQLYQQAAFWRQESVRVYRQIFPADSQVVNPRVQMQQHLQRAGGESASPRLLAQMNRLQTLVSDNQDVRLTTLAYDGNRHEIRLAFSTPGYPELEQFQQQAERDYQVQHGEIRQSGSRVEGQMTLKGLP